MSRSSRCSSTTSRSRCTSTAKSLAASSHIGTARYTSSSSHLLEKKLQQAQGKAAVPNLTNLPGGHSSRGQSSSQRLSERNIKLHQKQLSHGQSARSTGSRYLKSQGAKSIASASYRSGAKSIASASYRSGSECHSETTSAFFERYIDEKQATHEQLKSIDPAGIQNTVRANENSAPQDNTASANGLAQLDAAIGASRKSLVHLQGELLRNANDDNHESAATPAEQQNPITDPITRLYPAHPVTKDSGMRVPLTQGYGMQMSVAEAKSIVESSRSRKKLSSVTGTGTIFAVAVDKENLQQTGGNYQPSDDAKSVQSESTNDSRRSTSTYNSDLQSRGFKPSKRMYEPRRRASSVASSIGIGAFDADRAVRTTKQEEEGYAQPDAMRQALQEVCSRDGAFYHNVKSDISEYNEARVKFGALHRQNRSVV